MTTLIAIYGAVLSTIVAILHVRAHWKSERYIHIKAQRYIGDSSELLQFDISNRAKDPTEIVGVTIGNYGNGGDVGFHQIWAAGRRVFKGHCMDEDKMEVSLPLRLGPGETVACSYETEDVRHDVQLFWHPDIIPNEKFSNLFFVEVEHSRSNRGKKLLFEMDLKYLDEKFSDWKSMVSSFSHWRYFPFNRHY